MFAVFIPASLILPNDIKSTEHGVSLVYEQNITHHNVP